MTLVKVMIIDDDSAMTKLLKTLLELDSTGFEVTIVARGLQAVEKAQANPPHVFMVDYNLADSDGLEVVHNLRSHPRFANTPIIMSSGLDVEKEALENGVDMFLLKPFEPGDLPEIFLGLLN